MTVSLKHAFNNAIADDPADALAGKTLPSHWNAEHNLTGTANALFGFSAAGAGIDLVGTSWDATNKALALTGVAAASVSGLLLNGTWFSGGSSTTTKPQLLVEPAGTTSNAWSTSGTGLGINAASAFVGQLFDFQVNGVSKFRVDFAGGWNGTGGGGLTLLRGANANPGANQDYVSMFEASNIWFLVSGRAGTGTQRDFKIGLDSSGAADLYLRTAGVDRIKVAGSGGVTTFSYPTITVSYAQMTEMTAPGAPSADNVRIYAEDSGGGKTRLMAIFPTGAAQQIAIEP